MGDLKSTKAHRRADPVVTVVVAREANHVNLHVWISTPNRTLRAIRSRPISEVRRALRLMNDQIAKLAEYSLDWEDRHASEKETALSELRDAGRSLTRTLFPNGTAEFLSVATLTEAVCVLTQDEELSFPWDFLVFENDGREFCLGDAVLPHRHYETVGPFGPGSLDRFIGPETEHLAIAYADDDGLERAIKRVDGRLVGDEFDALLQIASSPDNVAILHDLNPNARRDGEVSRFKEWLGVFRHLFHFCCHAEPSSTARADSRLRLRKGFWLAGHDLQIAEHYGDFHRAVVVLNACSSGTAEFSSKETLAQPFLDQNAAVVVCTTGPVSDKVACEFARRFYGKLREPGQTVIEALRRTRRELAVEFGHPLPLLYSLYGQGHLTLRPA